MGQGSILALGAMMAFAGGQENPSPILAPAPVETSLAAPLQVAAQTIVMIEIAEELSSRTAVQGQRFAIRLAEPIRLDGDRVLVPAGVMGEGEVIHVRKAGFAGKAGELIVAARHLNCGSTSIPLGRFKFGSTGDDRSKTAGAVGAAASGVAGVLPAGAIGTVVAFMIKGGQIEVPVGARGTARLKTDFEATEEAVAACGAAVAS